MKSHILLSKELQSTAVSVNLTEVLQDVFEFHLRDDVHFNYTIVIDICYLPWNGDNKPALHVVDEAIDFQAAHFW